MNHEDLDAFFKLLLVGFQEVNDERCKHTIVGHFMHTFKITYSSGIDSQIIISRPTFETFGFVCIFSTASSFKVTSSCIYLLFEGLF